MGGIIIIGGVATISGLVGRRSQRASAECRLSHTRTLYYVLHWVAERGTEGVLRRVELRLP